MWLSSLGVFPEYSAGLRGRGTESPSVRPRGNHVPIATRFLDECGRNSEKPVTSQKDLQSGQTETHFGKHRNGSLAVCASWLLSAGCAYPLMITLCIVSCVPVEHLRCRAGHTRDVVCVRIRQEKGPFLTLHDACFGDKYLSDLRLSRLNISDLLTQNHLLYTPSLA